MEKSVIIYASVDGQTKKICNHIEKILLSENQDIKVFSITDFDQNIADYDKIIIASSIRYGKHNADIEAFIDKNNEILNTKKSVFISVNLVARKAEKSTATTNPYVVKFIDKIRWQPTHIEVFAGRLNYKMYNFMDRQLIRLIMLITKGPTDPKTEIEYTDWDKVTAFAKKFVQL
ncbi:MAG: menaquinone-dependent protoporphyrinogen IX dehydrogenase [Capnocytophaga sp.]|nr:menaquinone-dependent protoporphyrinogen IX dehydrogenase [Capnocytophaga sp.]